MRRRRRFLGDVYTHAILSRRIRVASATAYINRWRRRIIIRGIGTGNPTVRSLVFLCVLPASCCIITVYRYTVPRRRRRRRRWRRMRRRRRRRPSVAITLRSACRPNPYNPGRGFPRFRGSVGSFDMMDNIIIYFSRGARWG